MKRLEKIKTGLLLMIFTLMTSVYSFAQDAALKVDVTKTTETQTWYTNPWVWIVGVAVFILLFAAIVRGGGRRTDA